MTKAIAAHDYVIIDDGHFMFPVKKSDLLDGDTEQRIAALDHAEYGDWCEAVPMDDRHGDVNTDGCIEFCKQLAAEGAATWTVA